MKTQKMKRYWPLLVFGILNAFIILLLFRARIYHNASLQYDISLFFQYASKVFDGNLPYRDFSIEYPPLALVFFVLPRLIAHTQTAYLKAFGLEILVFDLLALFLLFRIAEKSSRSPAWILGLYTVLIFAAGPIFIFRFDLIPAVLTLAALYLYTRRKYLPAWIVLALAVMTKVYPAVIAPVLILDQLTQQRLREAIKGAIAFGLTAGLTLMPGIIINGGGLLKSFTMQMQRGLHCETVYSSFILLAHNLGFGQVSIRLSGPTPISINLVSPVADSLAKIAPAIMLPLLAIVYWLFFRRRRAVLPEINPDTGWRPVVHYSLMAILVFILTGNVFSPQFLIWLLPLIPLIERPWRHWAWILFVLAALLTYYIYPMHYASFMRLNPLMSYLLLVRNLILIILMTAALAWQWPHWNWSWLHLPDLKFQPVYALIMVVLMLGGVFITQVALNRNVQAGDYNRTSPMRPGPGFNSNNGFPGRIPNGASPPNFNGQPRPQFNSGSQPGNPPPFHPGFRYYNQPGLFGDNQSGRQSGNRDFYLPQQGLSGGK
jgi:hypothetical protein